jgi:hypothetical protein
VTIIAAQNPIEIPMNIVAPIAETTTINTTAISSPRISFSLGAIEMQCSRNVASAHHPIGVTVGPPSPAERRRTGLQEISSTGSGT